MLSPARMKKVDVLVLEKDVRQVAEALGELSAVHFTNARHGEQAQLLQKPEAAERYRLCTALLERAATLCRRLYVEAEVDTESVEYIPIEMIEERLASIEQGAAETIKQEDEINAEIDALTETANQVEAFRRLNVAVEDIPAFSFLHFATGRISEEKLSAFEAEAGPNVVAVPLAAAGEGERWIVAVTSKKGRWALESALEKQGFRPEVLSERFRGLPQEIYAHAVKRLEELQNRKEELAVRIRELGRKYGHELLRYRRRLHIEQKVLQAEEQFGRTAAIYAISGWTPKEQADALVKRILEITGNRAVIELRDPQPEREDVPILLRHGRLIKPFELLVSNYGLPGYREIEPTIVVAISFLAMFGVMFGDVGQGAVLVVAGLIVARTRIAPKLRGLGSVAVFAGIAAMLGGFVFGEFFGREFERLALWRPPLEKEVSLKLLGICIVFGMFMNSLGLVLNIINCFRRKDLAAAMLDKFGLAGLVFYWGALWIAAKGVLLHAGPGAAEIVLLLILPVMAIFFRAPILRLLAQHISADGHGGFIESGMDVFEMVIGLLSNTVSFVRVGAFALAHAGLGLAIYSLAGAARQLPAGLLISILIIIGGNIVVIVFEGLVVAIQCIRLEYYEFFAKFFKGEGKPFTPFTLRAGS